MTPEEKKHLEDVAKHSPETEFLAVRNPNNGKFAVWLKRHMNFAKSLGLKLIAIADTVGNIVENLENKNETAPKTKTKRRAKKNDNNISR
jgi:hypothetical protein